MEEPRHHGLKPSRFDLRPVAARGRRIRHDKQSCVEIFIFEVGSKSNNAGLICRRYHLIQTLRD